jgi:hypothetical protein
VGASSLQPIGVTVPGRSLAMADLLASVSRVGDDGGKQLNSKPRG